MLVDTGLKFCAVPSQPMSGSESEVKVTYLEKKLLFKFLVKIFIGKARSRRAMLSSNSSFFFFFFFFHFLEFVSALMFSF